MRRREQSFLEMAKKKAQQIKQARDTMRLVAKSSSSLPPLINGSGRRTMRPSTSQNSERLPGAGAGGRLSPNITEKTSLASQVQASPSRPLSRGGMVRGFAPTTKLNEEPTRKLSTSLPACGGQGQTYPPGALPLEVPRRSSVGRNSMAGAIKSVSLPRATSPEADSEESDEGPVDDEAEDDDEDEEVNGSVGQGDKWPRRGYSLIFDENDPAHVAKYEAAVKVARLHHEKLREAAKGREASTQQEQDEDSEEEP